MTQEELYAAIGGAVVRGATLELQGSLLAMAALGLPQRQGIYLLGRENLSRLLDRTRDALATATPCEGRDAAAAWVADVRVAYARRNEVVHSQIVASDEGGRLSWVRLRTRLDGNVFERMPVDFADLVDLNEQMTDLARRFDEDVTRVLIRDLPYTRAAFGHPPGR